MMFFKKKESKIKAYATGKVIPITEVQDTVFSQKMMGDGLAIYPEEPNIYAPCDGVITAVFEKTQHAIGMTLSNGMELLLHVGLDTVNLTEPVFSCHVRKDEKVKQGQLLISYDKAQLERLSYQDVTMCVILNQGNAKQVEIQAIQKAIAKETVIIKY